MGIDEYWRVSMAIDEYWRLLMSLSGIGWIPERLNNKSTYGAKNSEKYFQIFGKILSKIRIPDPKTLFLTEGGAARRGLKAPQVIGYVRQVWNGREDLQKLS